MRDAVCSFLCRYRIRGRCSERRRSAVRCRDCSLLHSLFPGRPSDAVRLRSWFRAWRAWRCSCKQADTPRPPCQAVSCSRRTRAPTGVETVCLRSRGASQRGLGSRGWVRRGGRGVAGCGAVAAWRPAGRPGAEGRSHGRSAHLPALLWAMPAMQIVWRRPALS